MRFPTLFLLVACVDALAGLASAADTPSKAQCVEAYDASQRSRRSGKLRETRDLLLVCSNLACPEVVKPQCTQWLGEVEASLPTIVLEAHDGDGNALADVRVSIDGGPIAERLTGRALEVDPGDHTVRFEVDGKVVEVQAIATEGVKLQKVSATIGQPTPHFPPPGGERVRAAPSPLVWVLGAVGLAALGVGIALDVSGKIEEGDLKSTCAPMCTTDQVSEMRTRVLVGDITLVAGIVTLGVAGVLWLARGYAPAKKASLPWVVRF
jgi:hypothetical protein